MNRLVPSLALLLGVSVGFGSAQEVGSPTPGSFSDFARRRLPEPSLNSDLLISDASGSPEISSFRVIPPKYPFRFFSERLPGNDSRIAEYSTKSAEFFQLRQQLESAAGEFVKQRNADIQLKALSGSERLNSLNYIVSKTAKWNGDIFWAPASKESDINLKYADEVRAVFGPIPPFDVTTLGKRTTSEGWTINTAMLFVEVEGNQVKLKPNMAKPGAPLEFEHRDPNGNFIKWTTTVDKCDKPSLAGGVTPCGTASRISRAVKGNVEWIALARKARGVEPLTADPFWAETDTSYTLIGYIGFNRFTGEVAFFDGTYEGMRFSWDRPTIQPGGAGYNDEQGRALASKTYDSTFRINCAGCHDNKEPRIITPYIKQSRVGYRNDQAAAAFSNDVLPELARLQRAPYRVIGSSYTAKHKETIDSGMSVFDPSGNCTDCHGLTNLNTARFASDSVGKLGSLQGDDAIENAFRTDWSLRSGPGQIHPWMTPQPNGNDLTGDPLPAAISDADWQRLRAVLENPSTDMRSLRLYTEAPSPESELTEATRIGDPAGPGNFAVNVADNRDGSSENLPKEIHLNWTYLNALGGVPERDDVRFNVAVVEKDISASNAPPVLADYPSLSDVKGDGASDLGGGLYTDGRMLIFKDLTFVGHKRWTDPPATTTPRLYRLDFPALKNKRYLIRVSAKRFTFDQSNQNYSSADHVLFVDVR